jgi:hypothetical protein
VETTGQDDVREVKRLKRHIYNNISQRAKKSTEPVQTSAAVKMLPKAMLTSPRLSELLTWARRLPEQEAPRKPERPPPIVMTSTTNLIRLQSDFKTTSKESTNSEIYDMELVS